jgi:hypothetical protein
MVNVSIYIKDARAQELSLIGGENSIHDWWYLLINWDLLHADARIGGFVHFLAAMLFVIALALGAMVIYRDTQVVPPLTPPRPQHP